MVANIAGIEEVNVETWEEFEKELSDLFCDNDPEWLFRGHNNSEWKLEATLDRILNRGNQEPNLYHHATLEGYYNLMINILPRVEEETGRTWSNMPAFSEYRNRLSKCQISGLFNELPGYEFMAYLRHHGFPSPLLDWTSSPFIAAFFAFGEDTDAQQVSIHAYRERTPCLATKELSLAARIVNLDNNARMHKRHFLQQSHYTISVENIMDGSVVYVSHEEAMKRSEGLRVTVRKYCIPSGERDKVLNTLRRYNLNSFSLFGTVESLMETLWSDFGLVRP